MVAHNLPTFPTPFIGRTEEIAALSQLLDDPNCRLLTLVGPGGIGKTRLAVEITRGKLDVFPDGIYFVPLQPLNDVTNIPAAIASALNIHLDSGTETYRQLLAHLAERKLLLMLDNFEHLLTGADLAADLVEHAPGLKLLVTSREPLNVRAEWSRQVYGMRFPDSDLNEPIDSYSAIQLFAERARRMRGDFDLAAERTHVIRLCQLLGGMPLGIELAVGWLRTMTCKQIADEVGRNLDFLTAQVRDALNRHRSIRAVFDHSWSLMESEEQAIFRRLSIFRGGFTREAAEAVAGASFWILSSLVGKSLITLRDSGRYDMHELLRQYAEEKLEAAGETDAICDAHSAYYLRYVAERLPDLKGRRQRDAIFEIDTDFENVRSAWEWAVKNEDNSGLDSVMEALFIFYIQLHSQRRPDGESLMQHAFDRYDLLPDSKTQPTWWRLRARLPNDQRSRVLLQDCLNHARDMEDMREEAFCLSELAHVHMADRDRPTGVACNHQSIAIYHQLGDDYHTAEQLFQLALNLGEPKWTEGEGYDITNQSLAIRQRIGDRIGWGWSIMSLGDILVGRGQHRQAEQLLRQSMAAHREMDFWGGISVGTLRLGWIAFRRGDLRDASALFAEALSLGQRYHYPVGQATSALMLAVLAYLQDDLEIGQRWLATGEQLQLIDPHGPILWTRAVRALMLGDSVTAEENLRLSLAGVLNNTSGFAQAPLQDALATLALAKIADSPPEQIVEWLGLASSVPDSSQSWLEQWPLYRRIRADLEHELGGEAFATCWERGTQDDLEATIRQILADEDLGTHGKAREVHPTLIEPLSHRETEVLHLLGEGLTNREVAQKLVLTVGTVKVHTRNIYGKLNVHTRVQAVNRARDLGLI